MFERRARDLPDDWPTACICTVCRRWHTRITLQCFNDCPNWRKTGERLRRIIAEHDLDATVEYQLIETPDDAEWYQFAGSPTLLFDGVDPFEPG
ncbi:MAG: hypothetical protein OEM32_05250 [Acidimicrobiia bacterium]|nr:hypothetical protein [Acidimicrobiia bacterium]